MNGFLLLVAPSRNVAKVRFQNEKEEVKGLGCLFDGGYVVNCYANDVYGLTSEKQLKALEASGAKYEIVN